MFGVINPLNDLLGDVTKIYKAFRFDPQISEMCITFGIVLAYIYNSHIGCNKAVPL